MTPDRRQFLTLLGGAAAVAVAGCTPARRATSPSTTGAPSPAVATTTSTIATGAATSTSIAASAPPLVAPADRVLVVLQLGGGNDGLNTLVPVQGAYHDARPTLAVADDRLVPFPGTDGYGLHPALAPLGPLLAAGRVAAVEAIGYPDPDRSHFAALDDWWTATPGAPSTRGWLGRWLDATTTGADDPLRAVALGGGAPALLGDRTRPTVVLSPRAFTFAGADGVAASLPDLLGRGGDGDAVARYRRAVAEAADAVATFASLRADTPADGADVGEGADGEVAVALATAAALVRQVPATRVIQVSVGGFDTHAGQAATHERLLADVAAGVASFFAALEAAGAAGRVLLVTVSEFGRRVAENGSGGTDHGKAGVSFAVGAGVRGGVYGHADVTRPLDGDLAPDVDPRSLYANALDWLGGPTDEVLAGSWDRLGLLRG